MQQTEKKQTAGLIETYSPETASAAAAEVGKALGIGLDAHSGAALLAGGNQLLLRLMDNAPQTDGYEVQSFGFSEAAPVSDFNFDGMGDAGGSVDIAFSGGAVGVTDVAAV